MHATMISSKNVVQSPIERVLIADDDPRVRAMLNIILMREKHIVVGMASGGAEAVRLVATAAPSLMLLDLDMPRMEGLATLREVHKLYPWLPVLVFSMLDPDVYARRCARLGARGFLSKHEGATLLPDIVGQIRKGVMLFPRQVYEGELPFSNLSDRELIALRCLVRGGDIGTISAALLVSREGANILRRRLVTKLGLSTIKELIHYGRHLKLS